MTDQRARPAQLAAVDANATVEASTTRDGSWADYGLPEPLPPRPAN